MRTNTAIALAFVSSLAVGQARAWTTGPVAHYKLDGNGVEATGLASSGVVVGAVPAADRFGNPSGAMEFDGVDDFIHASAATLPTTDRTVSLWFYADQDANRPGLIGYGGGACGTSWFQGLNNAVQAFNRSYYVTTHCQVKNLIVNYGTAPAPVAQWRHWVMTTDPSGTRMYVDGVLVGSSSVFINNTSVAGTELAMGAITSPGGVAPFTDGNSGWFDGRLDDVQIYDRALTPGEVQSVFLTGSLCSASIQPSQVVRAGSPPNPNALLPGVTHPPALGQTWDPVIAHATFVPGSLVDVLIISLGPVNIPTPSSGTLLCDLATPHVLFTAAPGMPFAVPIPSLCALAGFQVYCQGASLTLFNTHLTNAIDVTIGTL